MRTHRRGLLAPRSVFVVGNDGSGKTTFSAKLVSRARSNGLRVSGRRYYGNFTRAALRGAIERLTRASSRKMAPESAAQAEPKRKGSGGGGRRIAVLGFLWVYQTAIGLESRVRDWFSLDDLVVVDRSFIDDLVSIGATLRTDVPRSIVRYSAFLFPMRRLYFLSAGDEVEYGRILDVDLSREFHRAKGDRYRELISYLEPGHPELRRVSTRGAGSNNQETAAT